MARIGPEGVTGGGGEVNPSTPLARSRSSSTRKDGNGEGVSSGELSPGLLDLHSFDTELVPEVRKVLSFADLSVSLPLEIQCSYPVYEF